MSFTQTVYDWLGKKLSTTATGAITSDVASCAYMELARYIGASYVSAAIQACDIRFYDESGHRVMDDAAWLWNVSPNQDYSAAQLVDAMVNQMFTKGESLVVPWKSWGTTSLYVADDWILDRPHGVSASDHFTNVVIEGQPCGRDYYASQVYRFNLDATPDHRFTTLNDEIGKAYSRLATSASEAYASGNVKRFRWKRSQSRTGDNAEDKKNSDFMTEQVRKFVTSEGVSVWPQYVGDELEPFEKANSTANASTDFVSIRKDMFELAATCMRMPTSMLYGNVNNFSTVFDSFITFAIDPVAKVIGTEITRKTYTQDQWSHGAHCDLDTSQIKHRDLYDAASDIDKLIADGVSSVNDVLSDFGRDRIDAAWAEEHLRTKNYETADSTAGGENNG